MLARACGLVMHLPLTFDQQASLIARGMIHIHRLELSVLIRRTYTNFRTSVPAPRRDRGWSGRTGAVVRARGVVGSPSRRRGVSSPSNHVRASGGRPGGEHRTPSCMAAWGSMRGSGSSITRARFPDLGGRTGRSGRLVNASATPTHTIDRCHS